MKIRRIRKKSKKHFVKRFFHEKTFFLKKRFFSSFFFIGRTCVFLQRIFSSDRDLPAACAAALVPCQTKVPGIYNVHATVERAFFLECRVPRRKNMLFVKFLFLWADLAKRILAARCADRRTWRNPRGYLSISRRDAPVAYRCKATLSSTWKIGHYVWKFWKIRKSGKFSNFPIFPIF